jgi:hypothetical protein
MEISPEVLTNSLFFILSDMKNEKQAIVNISLIKDWRFLPNYCFASTVVCVIQDRNNVAHA